MTLSGYNLEAKTFRIVHRQPHTKVFNPSFLRQTMY